MNINDKTLDFWQGYMEGYNQGADDGYWCCDNSEEVEDLMIYEMQKAIEKYINCHAEDIAERYLDERKVRQLD